MHRLLLPLALALLSVACSHTQYRFAQREGQAPFTRVYLDDFTYVIDPRTESCFLQTGAGLAPVPCDKLKRSVPEAAEAIGWLAEDGTPLLSSVAPCPAPFTMLPGGSCLALPAQPRPDTPVLLYLHGMAASAQVARAEAVPLAQAAVRAGLAVLAPLGEPGACTWRRDLATWRCWPTGDEQLTALGKLPSRFEADLGHVAAQLGASELPRPVLVGFSNGGFSAVRLVAQTQLPLRALAVLHAGAPGGLTLPNERALPTLLRTARGDVPHFPRMQALSEQLQAPGWAREWQEREGAHALTEEDIAAVVDFAARLGAKVASPAPH